MMKRLRLLITGGSSFLGRHLVPLAQRDFDVTFTYFQNDVPELGAGFQLDVCDTTAVHTLITNFQPHIIIHTAGSNRGSNIHDTILKSDSNDVF